MNSTLSIRPKDVEQGVGVVRLMASWDQGFPMRGRYGDPLTR